MKEIFARVSGYTGCGVVVASEFVEIVFTFRLKDLVVYWSWIKNDHEGKDRRDAKE